MSEVSTVRELLPRSVTTWADAQIMRKIRNTGRHNLRDRSEISEVQQSVWWSAQSPEFLRAWLYSDEEGRDVGYGLVRLLEGRRWVTVVVLPEFQGIGYGTFIHVHLVRECPGEALWAEQLATNIGARKSAERAGFKVFEYVLEDIYKDGEYVILVNRPEVQE